MKPGTVTTKPLKVPKLGKVKNLRVAHPLIGADDGYPFTAVPEDYDARRHLPIKRSDFADEALFFEWRANLARVAAVRFDKLAAEARATGGTKDRAAAKRLVKMSTRMAELIAKLRANGTDVDAILAAVAGNPAT